MNYLGLTLGIILIFWIMIDFIIMVFKKDYFSVTNGYKFDRRIFYTVIASWLMVMFYLVNQSGLGFETQYYANCEPSYPDRVCINSIYGTEYQQDCPFDWCDKEYLEAGEYGTSPPENTHFNYFWIYSIIILAIGLLINHLRYNTGKKFTTKTLEAIKKNMEDD